MHTSSLFTAIMTAVMAGAALADSGQHHLADFLGVAPEALQVPAKESPNLLFQTNRAYDPRLDLRADQVIVHRHGAVAEAVAEAVASWQAQNYDVIRMFFVSSDAGQHFEQGRVTGEPRPDVMETRADGTPLRIEGHRAYMFPDPDWVAYMKTFVRQAVELGTAGIAPEEPFGHAHTGYEAAYQRLWEERTGTPWMPPLGSVENFYAASQFKSDAFHDMIAELSAYGKQAAREQGVEDFQVLLPIHSILSNMSGGRIFPNVRSIALEDVDGWIAQVWQGPVLWALGNLAGERHDGFFESALGLYSTFAELSRGTDKTMYFLVDPVEDDPNRTWATYKKNYEKCVVAMLQFPWVDHYEIMPWPDRIFMPGYGTGSGTPGPADYLTQLMAVTRALDEMPLYEAGPSPNDQGFGYLIADTASWEVHGPESPHFEDFHGMYLPFAVQGVQVRTPWLERAAELGYLNSFRVLALSYDMQKPETPEIHDGLLAWVRNGGWLVLVGGDSAYNAVDAWWTRAGFASPSEALLDAAGIPYPGSRVSTLGQIVDAATGQRTPADTSAFVYEGVPEAQVLLQTEDGAALAFEEDIGHGGIVRLGTPARWGGYTQGGVEVYRRAVQQAARNAGGELQPMNTVSIQRGPYLAAYVMDAAETFEGTYIDLFHPEYPILTNPEKAAGAAALLKSVSPQGDAPQVLFATHRLVHTASSENEVTLLLEGPSETLAAARITSPAGKTRATSAEALDADGNPVPVIHKYDPDTRSSLVQFTYHPQGVALRMTWE